MIFIITWFKAFLFLCFVMIRKMIFHVFFGVRYERNDSEEGIHVKFHLIWNVSKIRLKLKMSLKLLIIMFFYKYDVYAN